VPYSVVPTSTALLELNTNCLLNTSAFSLGRPNAFSKNADLPPVPPWSTCLAENRFHSDFWNTWNAQRNNFAPRFASVLAAIWLQLFLPGLSGAKTLIKPAAPK